MKEPKSIKEARAMARDGRLILENIAGGMHVSSDADAIRERLSEAIKRNGMSGKAWERVLKACAEIVERRLARERKLMAHFRL